MNKDRTIFATALTIIFITAVTIAADLSPMLKTWLKDTFTHHWIGKGVLATVLWLVVVILPVKPVAFDQKKFKLIVSICTILIVLFYITHFLKLF